MKLKHGIHLAYCTNVHRGETWAETFAALENHVLPVRQRVAAGRPYAIGLRLGHNAATELAVPATLAAFKAWLARHDCYVFTVNGFPYGNFHGTRVKELAYAPDWSTPERLAYTQQLFEILVQLSPAGEACSVSTVPGSFKGFITAEPSRRAAIFKNVTAIGRFIAQLASKTGRDLHIGFEPEPACYFETSEETVQFFADWRASDPAVDRENLLRYVGVNYDCCHLGVEFESATVALNRLAAAGIRISKLHLSSALRVKPDAVGRKALEAFVEPRYLHQVVVGRTGSHDVRRRYVDLPDALADATPSQPDDEWRIHFHVPLHAAPGEPFGDTRHHLTDALDWMAAHRGACTHFEMETYTWEVLPQPLRLSIEDQLASEYAWTLDALAQRDLA